MKVVLLTDTHFGVRGDQQAFHDNMSRFYEHTFWPYIAEHNIKKIIHLGDVFDNRKKIDMNTASQARTYFFEPAIDNDVQIDIIAGNHDLYFRESSSVTALREILGLYKNIVFVTEPAKDGPFQYVPWINKENYEISMYAINSAVKPILLGHFDIVGYKMYRNQVAKHGLDPDIFNAYKHVYSGHYHHRHTIGNISYLGSPSQHNWADAGDIRGFHVYDTSQYEIEFIENPFTMFETIKYPTSQMIQEKDVKGKFVRIEHGDIDKQSKFDEFVKVVESYNPSSLTLISNRSDVKIDTDTQEISVNVEDTPTLIKSVVDDASVADYLIDLHNKVVAL